MHQRQTHAQRWYTHAQLACMDSDACRHGAWLIDLAETDMRHGDSRLFQLLGREYFGRMMKFGLNKPLTAQRVWRYMIERRRLPPR